MSIYYVIITVIFIGSTDGPAPARQRPPPGQGQSRSSPDSMPGTSNASSECGSTKSLVKKESKM